MITHSKNYAPEYFDSQNFHSTTSNTTLILFICILFFSITVNADPSTLKVNNKIDVKSLAHATKLAQLYTKVRMAFINYDIAVIRANSFVPKNKAAPPQKQMLAFGKTLPDIFTFTLVKVVIKGRLTGLWLIKKNPTSQSTVAILFRFKQDSNGQWRIHPRTYQEVDTDNTKKPIPLLIKSLPL